MEEKVSKKQMEEELTELRKEILEELTSKKQEEIQAIVPSAAFQKLDLDTSLVPLNSDLDSSLVKLEKYEEQLTAILTYVRRIESQSKSSKNTKAEEWVQDLQAPGHFPLAKPKQQLQQQWQQHVVLPGCSPG